jgi:hypothetical protein
MFAAWFNEIVICEPDFRCSQGSLLEPILCIAYLTALIEEHDFAAASAVKFTMLVHRQKSTIWLKKFLSALTIFSLMDAV